MWPAIPTNRSTSTAATTGNVAVMEIGRRKFVTDSIGRFIGGGSRCTRRIRSTPKISGRIENRFAPNLSYSQSNALLSFVGTLVYAIGSTTNVCKYNEFRQSPHMDEARSPHTQLIWSFCSFVCRPAQCLLWVQHCFVFRVTIDRLPRTIDSINWRQSVAFVWSWHGCRW